MRAGEAGHERLTVGAIGRDDGVAIASFERGADHEPDRPPRCPAQLDGDRPHLPAHPRAFGLHRDHLVEVERQRQRGRVAPQLARRQRARDGLVGHEQHALATSEIHDAGVIAVGGATGVVGRHAGLRRHGPPLRLRLPGARLRAAVRDDAAQRSTERAVRRLIEELERRAVRGAVGRQLGIHVSRQRSWIAAHRTGTARPLVVIVRRRPGRAGVLPDVEAGGIPESAPL